MRGCVLLCLMAVSVCNASLFTESLTLKVLPDEAHMEADFVFTTRVAATPLVFRHFSYFPKSFGQLMEKYKVLDMDLVFVQSLWQYDVWGAAPERAHGPVGAKLSICFDQDDIDVDLGWKRLANALSGLFGASLGTLDELLIAEGSSKWERSSNSSSHCRMGYLPREAFCTENLTPWSKLLLCKYGSGFGSLLNPYALFDSEYIGLSVSFMRKETESGPVLELVQALSVVAPIDETDLPFVDRVEHASQYDDMFILNGMFDVVMEESCPLANESTLVVHGSDKFVFVPTWEIEVNGVKDRVWDLKSVSKPDVLLVLAMNDKNSKKADAGSHDADQKKKLSKSSLRGSGAPAVFERYMSGQGQERGCLVIEIQAGGKDVLVNYFDILPWYMEFYAHNFECWVDGVPCTAKDRADLLREGGFSPGRMRKRPTILDIHWSLVAHSRLNLKFYFDKGFLDWTEHPPDAHRGFDIPAARLRCQYKKDGPIVWEAYSRSMLLVLPTPDFSMPYNVITLSGTVFAMFFGSILNALIRRVKRDPRTGIPLEQQRPLFIIIERVAGKLKGLFKKKSE